MEKKKVVVGCDHAGFDKKVVVVDWLQEHSFEVEDVGTYSKESVDYPDYALLVTNSLLEKRTDWGVLLCGSGVGVCISSNKVSGIRASLVFHPDIARLSREHNNANVMCLPASFLRKEDIEQCLENWTVGKFKGGRHKRRVDKIEKL